MTALVHACCDGPNDEIVKLLLDNGANPDKTDIDGKTALMRACERGQNDTVKSLLDNDADTEVEEHAFGHTAIFFAVLEGNPGTVQLLVDAGSNPSKVDKDGENVLSWACSWEEDCEESAALLVGRLNRDALEF